MSLSERITLHNEEKGDKLLALLVCDKGSPKKKCVEVYIGNIGQKVLPLVGYSSDEALVEFAEKFNERKPRKKP